MEGPFFNVSFPHGGPRLREGQNLCAVSFFRKKDRDRETFFLYYDGLRETALAFPKAFKGWMLRIYYDASLETDDFRYERNNDVEKIEHLYWATLVDELKSYRWIELVRCECPALKEDAHHHKALAGTLFRFHAMGDATGKRLVIIRDVDTKALRADNLIQRSVQKLEPPVNFFYYGGGYKPGHLKNLSKTFPGEEAAAAGMVTFHMLDQSMVKLIWSTVERAFYSGQQWRETVASAFEKREYPGHRELSDEEIRILDKCAYGVDELILNYLIFPLLRQREAECVMKKTADLYRPRGNNVGEKNLYRVTLTEAFQKEFQKRTGGLRWDEGYLCPENDNDASQYMSSGFIANIVYDCLGADQKTTLIYDEMLGGDYPIFCFPTIVLQKGKGQYHSGIPSVKDVTFANSTFEYFFKHAKIDPFNYELRFSGDDGMKKLEGQLLTAKTMSDALSFQEFGILNQLVLYFHPKKTYQEYMKKSIGCAVCGQYASMKCGGCLSIRYCGDQCASRDWASGGHHKVCQ